MRSRSINLILVMTAMLAISPALLAQAVPQGRTAKSQTAAPTPDLSGVWTRMQGRAGGRMEVPPMTPAGAEKYKVYAEATKGNVELRNLYDPVITSCAPPGPTRIGRSFEFIQTPGRVIILYETDHWVRQVWMDGRGHPKDLDVSWMGDSIGKYEGDTLVIDTVGLNDLTWLDNNGHPHSEALHVVERYRRVNHNTLEGSMMWEDSQMYSKPWTGKLIFQLDPDGKIVETVGCEDRKIQMMKNDPCENGAWELNILCDERRQRLTTGK